MFRSSIITIILCLLAAAGQAEPLRFRFRPPDSITFTVEVRTDRTRWFDSTKYPTDSSILVVSRTIKRTPGGYAMTAQPTSIVTKSDGKAADNPVNQILMETPVQSKLDTLGLITSVSGYERVPAQIDSLVPAQWAARLKSSLSPENLSAREQMEWNGKFEKLAGQEIDFSDIEYEASQYPLPGGTHIPFLLAIRVADTVTLNGKLCAILLISAGSDPNELTERLHVKSEEIAMHFPLHDGPGMAIIKIGSKYYSETRIVLEIATMLPQSESSQREITIMGEPGKGPRKMRLVEGESRRYVYHK